MDPHFPEDSVALELWKNESNSTRAACVKPCSTCNVSLFMLPMKQKERATIQENDFICYGRGFSAPVLKVWMQSGDGRKWSITSQS